MKFQQRCIIPATRDELWDFLLDVPSMASCVPGAEEVTPDGDSQFNGRLRFKLGPIRVGLQGVIKIQERDRDHWRAAAHAEAKDVRIGGGASVTGYMTLAEKGLASTELTIEGEARFLGKLGEFGEPVIRKQADAVVAEFVRNVTAHFERAASAPGQIHEPCPGEIPPQPEVLPQLKEMPETSPTSHIPWVGGVIGLALGLSLTETIKIFTYPLSTRVSLIIVTVLLGGLADALLSKRQHRSSA
jgi:uncharacterized protein